MRKGYRREVLLFLICAFSYIVGQLFVSQVSYSFPLLTTQANTHVDHAPPEVHFCVFILGRQVFSDDIRLLCMQRSCSPYSGNLPVVDYWMGLWWVTVAHSVLFLQTDAEVTSLAGTCRFRALLWQHCRHDRIQTSCADQIQLEVRDTSYMHCKCLKCSLGWVECICIDSDRYCFYCAALKGHFDIPDCETHPH